MAETPQSGNGRKKIDSNIAGVILAVLLSLCVSLLFAAANDMIGKSTDVLENAAAIVRVERNLEELQKAKEKQAVDNAALAAEVRAELRSISAQLEEMNKKFDRIERKR